MKRISIVFLFAIFTVAAFGQLPDSADMRIEYFGIPSQSPDPDFVKTQTGRLNARDVYINSRIDSSESYHMFIFFGDSAVSKSYTTSWATLTNASDSIFIQYELEGFTVFNDSIRVINAGDCVFNGQFTHDGDNGETVSIRFFNVSAGAGIPVAGAQTMRGSNNFGSTPVQGYYDITAGDTIIVQYKGDGNGTAVFKNASVLIDRLHE